MKYNALMSCLLLWNVLSGISVAQGDPVIVTLKGSISLTLKPVFLGLDGNQLIAARKMTLGNRSESDCGEALCGVELSGSFVGPGADNKPDWYYLLGETEVTRAQWNAVFGVKDLLPPTEAAYPKTGISPADIQLFLEKINQLTHSIPNQSLPRALSGQGFFRLPNEAEWEFAARGGLPAIKQNTFDMPHPYGDQNFRAFENYNDGLNSKPLKAGVSEPNPLGLRDMLGNVSEYTSGCYSLGYVHGRMGGWILRGGNYGDQVKYIRASRRLEAPPCKDNGDPMTDPTRGFRLCYASTIFSNKNADDVKNAWNGFITNRPVPQPGPIAGNAGAIVSEGVKEASDLAAKMKLDADKQINAIAGRNAGLEKEIENLRGMLQRQSNELNAKLAEVSGVVRAATRERAMADVRIGIFASVMVEREIIRIDAKKSAKRPEASIRENLNLLQFNKQTMDDCLLRLVSIEPNIVKECLLERKAAWREEFETNQTALDGFEKFEKELKKRQP